MKKTKILTCIAALGLVLSLGACDLSGLVSTDESSSSASSETTTESETTPEDGTTSESTSEDGTTSEGTSEGGTTSETTSEGGNTSENTSEGGSTSGSTSETEPTTLSNYTLSIGIQYGSELVEVPSYATAYIQGSWDTWTDWVALTPNSGRYEYTFETIDVDTYQYQLVLAYNDEQPGWTYRITQDGANASFTVKGSDGDSYTNEVTVTASKALTEIIPDPSAAISNVTLTIDITYNGESQDILDYGTLWIEGSWDWNAGFVACEVVDDKYVATFDSLSPIEYEFLGVIYYSDEELPDSTAVWDYKVNGNDNAKFTVSSDTVNATLEATQELSSILPPKSTEEEGYQATLTDYTLSIAIMYNGTAQTLPEYAHAYIEGGWDSWAQWIELDAVNGEYQHTFETIDVGTYEYQLVLGYEGEEPGWAYRITQDGANASFTVSGYEGDEYTNHVQITALNPIDEILPDPNAFISNVKVTIDITYNGVSQGVLDYGTLWIEGSWDWDAGFVACTVEDGHYVYTFDSLAPIEYEFLGVIYYSDTDLPTGDTLWDYKVNGTANATFIVSSDEVSATLEATNALSSILPDVSGGATSDSFTLKFTITYGGVVQSVPSYAEIYYAGDSNSWTFDKLTENGSTYDLVLTSSLVVGTTYQFGLLMDFKDDTSHLSGWTYKVNAGSGNETFSLTSSDISAGYKEISVTAKSALSDIIVEGDAVNVTFAFNVTSRTVNGDVYFTGSFNNDNWTTWLKCTYDSDDGYYKYTFDTLALGGVEYKVVMSTSTPTNGSWTGVTEITTSNQSYQITSELSNTIIYLTI